MSGTLDLGLVRGDTGPQGATGPQGPQGIPGPNTISEQTTSLLDGFLYANGSNVGTTQVCNPNLLDNAFFIGGGNKGITEVDGNGNNIPDAFPINQRAKTEYADGYGIDRWWSTRSDGYIRVRSNGVQIVTRTSGNAAQCLRQRFPRPLRRGTYTFSALVNHQGNSGSGTTFTQLVIRNIDNNYSADFVSSNTVGTGVQLLSLTFTLTTETNIAVEINTKQTVMDQSNPETTCLVYAAKLEVGTKSTLCYFDEAQNRMILDVPNYTEELAKCQRYQLRIGNRGHLNNYGFGVITAENAARIAIPTPVTMYGQHPTIELLGSIALSDLKIFSGNNIMYSLTGFGLTYSEINAVTVTCQITGASADVGGVGVLHCGGTANQGATSTSGIMIVSNLPT